MIRLLKTVILASIGVWAICALALLIYTRGARAPEMHTLVIPAGTSQLIAEGQNPLEIPPTWSFLADDTLQLVNRDRVDHWFGSYFVPALTTREFRLQPTIGGSLFCSLHPSGAITIDVDVRDFDWRSTIIPTLALGPALGLIWTGVARVLRSLDEPDERERKLVHPAGGST